MDSKLRKWSFEEYYLIGNFSLRISRTTPMLLYTIWSLRNLALVAKSKAFTLDCHHSEGSQYH